MRQGAGVDAPQKLIEARGAANLEDAFIGYMKDAIADAAPSSKSKDKAAVASPAAVMPAAAQMPSKSSAFKLRLSRMLAYTIMKPCRYFAIRFDWPSLYWFSITDARVRLWNTTDVEHIRYASFDLDQSPGSRAYLEQFAGASRYFTTTRPVAQRRGLAAPAIG